MTANMARLQQMAKEEKLDVQFVSFSVDPEVDKPEMLKSYIQKISSELRILPSRYAKEREEGEHFGDFVIRVGIIKAATDGTNLHD